MKHLKKLNNIGAAHIILPVLILLLVGTIGTYVAVKSKSHADTLSTITINPADWKISRGTIVSDGSAGNVVKLSVANASQYTGVKSTNGTTKLSKLVNYVKGNYGSSVQVCINGRYSKLDSSGNNNARVILHGIVAGTYTASSDNTQYFNANFTTAYSTKCNTYKFLSSANYAALQKGSWGSSDPNIEVFTFNRTGAFYVNWVQMTKK